VVNGITYPLPIKSLNLGLDCERGDKYKTKPELAVEIVQELKALGFKIKLVLATVCMVKVVVIGVPQKLELQFIVAIVVITVC